MNYKNYNVEDFLSDEMFKKWILSPTPALENFWKNIIDSNPELANTIEEAKNIAENISFNYTDPRRESQDKILFNIFTQKSSILLDSDAKNELLNDKRRIYQLKELQKNKVFISDDHRSKPGPAIYSFSKIAATIALILGVSYSFYFFMNDAIEAQPDRLAVQNIIKHNPQGQKSIIHLKDGTKVHLNVNSTLEYNSDYGISNRRVTLDGEAYFTVKKDLKNPFMVTSGSVVTTALGTEFNINTRNEDKTKIILTEGMIKVENTNENTTHFVLSPDQSIEYDAETGFSAVTDIKNLNEILWIQGILMFQHTPLSQVIKELENWYGVRIVMEDTTQDLHFSGKFKDEKLSNILTSMSFSLGLEYTQENDFVTLKLKK